MSDKSVSNMPLITELWSNLPSTQLHFSQSIDGICLIDGEYRVSSPICRGHAVTLRYDSYSGSLYVHSGKNPKSVYQIPPRKTVMIQGQFAADKNSKPAKKIITEFNQAEKPNQKPRDPASYRYGDAVTAVVIHYKADNRYKEIEWPATEYEYINVGDMVLIPQKPYGQRRGPGTDMPAAAWPLIEYIEYKRVW